MPPEGCAFRCRIFLRVCLLAKNHLEHDAGGAGVSIVSTTDVSNPVVAFPCTNALGDLTTGLVLKNNRLLNSSLDHQLQLKERNQRWMIMLLLGSDWWKRKKRRKRLEPEADEVYEKQDEDCA
ncbi:unnamed protein product [Dibothriocephalus latus]|uniref:Uncharacterized protein n=1 Tax=Dibothriocephalus latus TaxID=60516 RepID=A0A3P6TZS1_DIBLA|nr:unnamed protein product [Dibothriocephalus latus]